MKSLPNDSIGISDLLDWRECPQRMEYGMRRHVTLSDGKRDEPPGHTNWTNAYGSAIHDAIHLVEEGEGLDSAIERVWKIYGGYLDPEELGMLREDLHAYRRDSPMGMEIVAAERDVRVPLMIHNGVQIYFRFKIDALYRRKDNHTVFYQRDYKSSKHRRSQSDVDKDLQMWAYNWGIYELYPECASLIQSYEQLRFGNLTTSKNAEQRKQMRAWLEETVKAVLEDEKHEPKQNEWCPWCPLVATCDQSIRASRFWRGRLAVLAPLTKEGRKTRVAFADEGDDLEHMIQSVLPDLIQSRKHMQAVEKALKELIEELPNDERERLGWRLKDRTEKEIDPLGLRLLHEALGDVFYEAVSLSKSAAETVVGKPKKGEEPTPEQKLLADVQLERTGASMLVQVTNAPDA